MPGGRPSGSKNRRGHKAGGSRQNAGRPNKDEQAERARLSMERFQSRQREAAQRSNEPGPAAAAEAEKKRRDAEARKNALKELQASAHDQQIYDEEYCDARDVYPDLVDVDDASDDESAAAQSGDDNEDGEEVEDYETDDEGEGETKKRRNRARAAYMPPENSPLDLLLRKTKDRHKTSQGTVQGLTVDGRMWIPPEPDPLAASMNGPDRYCTADAWQFVWRPFKQFHRHVQLQNIGCIHGCDKGNHDSILKLKEMRWRPMFMNDAIVWLLHDRIECKVCHRCTSTIDPRFLQLMPTIVVERLPFITTAAGPGIHRSMLYLLNNLRTKQVTEGVLAGAINETHRIRYDHNRIAYYDRVAETAKVDGMGLYGQPKLMPPFPSFNSPGKFGGISLRSEASR